MLGRDICSAESLVDLLQRNLSLSQKRSLFATNLQREIIQLKRKHIECFQLLGRIKHDSGTVRDI
ncbi:hypothetical protein WT12_27780 [Burkholderia territorii]|nr:hypothetical protein WS94_08715 [Burkholderia territorii]KVL27495.1 hypothetical protein WS97_28240 [Burkholderia territorii]KVL45494.1 hypothetical protein WT00_28805 [Burkholderia territorii]KVN42510.1 hypothetical protein WT12_27780 [Burkholderia territorii]